MNMPLLPLLTGCPSRDFRVNNTMYNVVYTVQGISLQLPVVYKTESTTSC